jgi:hypothetical protein
MGLAMPAASAAPVQPMPQLGNSSIILAQYGDHRGHRQRYAPGRRYRSAPQGWHRYSRRPGDWRTRGCMLAGPVWFCP